MIITAAGNVGIGTTVPETINVDFKTLQIDGTSGAMLRTGTSTYGGYVATIPTADVMVISNVRNPINGTFSNTGKAGSVINLWGESNNGYLTFSTSPTNNTGPTERMRITSGGDLLIGTTSNTAGSKLVVAGDITAGTSLNQPTSYRINNDTNWAFGCYNSGSVYYMQVQFSGTGDDNRGFRVFNTTGSNIEFRVNGAGSAYLRGSLTQNASDKRLKDNIKNIENPLSKLMLINGVSFDWNQTAINNGFMPSTRYNDSGVIAQEIQKIIPEAIDFAPFDYQNGTSKSGENYLTVKYEKIIPLLIESIKELKAELDTYTGKNK
jgi:hypothetical protein